MLLRVTISLSRPMEFIPLALTGVPSRPAGNVSLDRHQTSNQATINGCLFLPFFVCTLIHRSLLNTYYLQHRFRTLNAQPHFLVQASTSLEAAMATISSELEGGERPKLSLFDLPREIRDQIYGYLVRDTYEIVPTLGPGRRHQSDDFRHLPILQVAKRVNWEAMQSLQRRSWFIYRMPDWPFYRRLYDTTITRYMMNVQIVIDRNTLRRNLNSVFWWFAGTKIERQTFVVLVPIYSLILRNSMDPTLWDDFIKHLQLIKLLTGFKTVVVQANLKRFYYLRRGKTANDEYCTKLLTDILVFSEPELGPFVPCNSEREEGYELNFKFSPLRFTAEQKQQRLAAERNPSITVED